MIQAIFTIGYEGATLADFLMTLRQADITLLFDIREVPLSRRKGFSKSALRQAAESAHIRYIHEKRLGSPKPIRDQLHKDQDYDAFFARFDDYLKTQADLLETLAQQLPGKIALMCYERDPSTCHRRSVAAALADLTGLPPQHLGVRKYDHATQKQRKPEARLDSGQGISTAQSTL